MPFQIVFEIGADSTVVTATTDTPIGSSVVFDKTSPSITPVTITSNNANPALAKPGDIITVAFTVNEPLFGSPVVTIDGKPATIGGVYPNYTAFVTTDNTYNEGVLAFNISLEDEVGNPASATAITSGTNVTFDKTLPFISTSVVDPADLNGIGTTNGTILSGFNYVVNFNENVTGVDISDFALFSLDGPSPGYPSASGSISSVTGGPQTYSVNITGATGTGRLRLDLVSDGTIADASGNLNSASFSTGQFYTRVLQQPTNHAMAFSASPVNPTSIQLNWSNPGIPAVPATHYLIRAKGLDDADAPGAYPPANDGTPVADDFDFSDGNGAVNLAEPLPTFYSFTTLRSGRTYDFDIIPYTLSPNTSSDNVNYLSAGQPTQSATTPTAAVGSITAGSTLPPATIGSLQTTFGSKNFTFKIRDDGLSLGADNSKTRFATLQIFAGPGNTVTTWSDVIAEAELATVTEVRVITTTAIASNSITFTMSTADNEEGELDDDEEKEYELRIRLKNPLTGTAGQTVDNQQFDFRVTAASVQNYVVGSSTIDAAQSVTSSSGNVVNVIATQLDFVTQPPANALVLTSVSPVPVVRARDANQNTDRNYATPLNIANAGSLPMNYTVRASDNASPNAGVYTLSGFQYTDDLTGAAGNGTLTVSAAGVSNGVSSSVTVSYSNTSTVVAGPYSEATPLSSLVTANPGTPVFDFILRDDNLVAVGTDGSPTRVSQIVITQGTGNDVANWTDAIAGAVLTDGTNSMTGTVGSTSITFSAIDITALGLVADNSPKTYTLQIWLNTIMGGSLASTIDNLNLVFEVLQANVTLTSLSSEIAPGENENSGPTGNPVQVVATQLRFTTNPGAPRTGCRGPRCQQQPRPELQFSHGYNDQRRIIAHDQYAGEQLHRSRYHDIPERFPVDTDRQRHAYRISHAQSGSECCRHGCTREGWPFRDYYSRRRI
jgi:hypothetical protein